MREEMMMIWKDGFGTQEEFLKDCFAPGTEGRMHAGEIVFLIANLYRLRHLIA